MKKKSLLLVLATLPLLLVACGNNNNELNTGGDENLGINIDELHRQGADVIEIDLDSLDGLEYTLEYYDGEYRRVFRFTEENTGDNYYISETVLSWLGADDLHPLIVSIFSKDDASCPVNYHEMQFEQGIACARIKDGFEDRINSVIDGELLRSSIESGFAD